MAFFMVRMLDHACVAEMKSEVLYCMQMKIIRRLRKLSKNGSSFLTGKLSIVFGLWTYHVQSRAGFFI